MKNKNEDGVWLGLKHRSLSATLCNKAFIEVFVGIIRKSRYNTIDKYEYASGYNMAILSCATLSRVDVYYHVRSKPLWLPSAS
jgi:hypothetical protein